MPPSQPLQITEEFLIVGEGAGDEKFFRYLCAAHAIVGFQSLDAGGTGKLEQFLKDLPARTGFRKCKALVVVGDNDDAPADSFKKIRLAVKRAKLPFPGNPLQIVKHTTSDLHVVIMMIPFDANGNSTRGCLETLLLQSASQQLPAIAGCIPAFGQCVGVPNWANRSHADKFSLRAILAAAFPHDPNFGLQYALDPAHGVIPLTHVCFGDIVTFIRDLPGKL